MRLPPWVLIALIVLGSRQAAAQSQPRGILLNTGNASHTVALSLQALPNSADKQLALILISLAPECRFTEEVFEVPVQLNETSFQLKRMVRLTQELKQEKLCGESLVAAFSPADFYYLSVATSVVMHLPSGPLRWSAEAIDYARSMKPSDAAPYPVRTEEIRDVPARLIVMAASGEAEKARAMAEAVAPIYVSRPAGEGVAFFAALGQARRATNDLPAAVVAYEVATMIAGAAGDVSGFAGVAYDNLATLRRLQRQFERATTASDRALEILAAAGLTGQLYGGALNNRALLLSDQGQAAAALEYSERALVILRQAFKNDATALAPFLEDNRQFRQNAEGR